MLNPNNVKNKKNNPFDFDLELDKYCFENNRFKKFSDFFGDKIIVKIFDAFLTEKKFTFYQIVNYLLDFFPNKRKSIYQRILILYNNKILVKEQIGNITLLKLNPKNPNIVRLHNLITFWNKNNWIKLPDLLYI
ncbi:MAG: hypothetical protein ACTSRZ_04815 [Promethearchaeota archaeon]